MGGLAWRHPMHSGRVLVVAPDHDLRHSLAFALDAYGYSVVAEEAWPREPGAERFDCVILDEHVLSEPAVRPHGLFAVRGPIVLLAYSGAALSQGWFDTILAMPLKGEAVVEAVVAVMARHSALPK